MKLIAVIVTFAMVHAQLAWALPALRSSEQAGGPEALRPTRTAEARVPITVEGPARPITWEVPAPVARAIKDLTRGSLTGEAAVQRMRELTAQAAREQFDAESLATMQASLSPIFFWILESLYDEAVSLDHQQRLLVEREVLDLISKLSGTWSSHGTTFDIFNFDREPRHDRLEAWWYLLVYLLAQERRLELQGHRETQLAFLRNVYSVVVFELHNLFYDGTLPEGKDFWVGRLIDLVRDHAELRVPIDRLLQQWDDWADGVYPMALVSPRFLAGYREESIAAASWVTRRSEEIVRDAEDRELLHERLMRLRAALLPKTGETIKAWDRPLQYLVERAHGVRVIIFDAVTAEDWPTSQKTELPDWWQFQLDWLDRMGTAGVKRWAFFGLTWYLQAVHRWAAQERDERPLEEWVDQLQGYLNARGELPIRSVLRLPSRAEPEAVTRALKFWQALRDLKRTHGATVMLIQSNNPRAMLEDPQSPLYHEFSDGDEPRLIMGDLGDLTSLLRGARLTDVNIGSFLTIKQMLGRIEYEGFFVPSRAFSFVGQQIGEEHGWGDRRSSAIPVAGNQALSDFVKQLIESDPKRGYIWELTLSTGGELFVITGVSEGDEEEAPWAPDEEPILERGPRVPVPVGVPGGGAPVVTAPGGPMLWRNLGEPPSPVLPRFPSPPALTHAL